MVSPDRNFVNEEFAAVFQIIEKLVEQDDFSPAEAVEQLIPRAVHAATLRSEGQNALAKHEGGVMGSICELAECTPPQKQSRLVEFFILLQKTEIPDAENGGVLTSDGTKYWSELPGIVVFADVAHTWWVERQSRTPEEDERQENFSAFLAQLSERNFCDSWYNTLSWNGNNLTSILKENNREVKALVRIVCMWLNFAPSKVRSDTTTGRQEGRFKFSPENWDEWKKILQESKSKFSDEDTQKLIENALKKMEEAEA